MDHHIKLRPPTAPPSSSFPVLPCFPSILLSLTQLRVSLGGVTLRCIPPAAEAGEGHSLTEAQGERVVFFLLLLVVEAEAPSAEREETMK